MENVRKHRDFKPLTNDGKITRLVAQPNYHIRKWFSENNY